MIEIGEAKEGTHVFDLGQGRPAGDAIEFDRIHG